MRGVIITDETEDNLLAVNLLDILRLLEPLALNSEWDISGLECFGSSADQLHQLADAKVRVAGRILLELAASLTQIIDGVFSGYLSGTLKPWIIVRAVDGFAYDVRTENEDVLIRIRQNFQKVIDIPCLPEDDEAITKVGAGID
ncbi:hypothetical protein [Iningainema tapete]|uniref:Uncharacterized protein n=1 Tax=Iningainema tapete BLCC-T55 TaxID=2748662 RepID=A0A8J7C0X3_9CYAN|nr:hypothetical protein [Iningainema tapete]MBD2778848.1 hypothetical protein [Iningainema tapete BLCC-T55]